MFDFTSKNLLKRFQKAQILQSSPPPPAKQQSHDTTTNKQKPSTDSKIKGNNNKNNKNTNNKSSQEHQHIQILPCTVSSHATGNYFDLQPLTKEYPHDSADWQIRGIDYPGNFTINFCAPLLLPVEFDDQGNEVAAASRDKPVKSALQSLDETAKTLENASQSYSANVSAVLRLEDGTLKSLGKASSTPYFRGRNLLLEYHDGSPCMNPDGSPTKMRMSTLVSFKCDHDLAASHALVSFLGAPDNCTFLFEARTLHACPASNKQESVAPVPIFLVISLVAFGVYAVASILLKPISAMYANHHHHNHHPSGTVQMAHGSSILPYSNNDKSSSSSSSTIITTSTSSTSSISTPSSSTAAPLLSSNFSFPFPFSFLNPVLYRLRRNHYVPGRLAAVSPDGEQITVFEAITPPQAGSRGGGGGGANMSNTLTSRSNSSSSSSSSSSSETEISKGMRRSSITSTTAIVESGDIV
ncbi:uncharacterized protein SAPINGB_P002403 [Magnusiomyces paraingens]|uniref:MRH domain-containing protein n=1 Tax=Magnusiomyces paraingens TaxID=2606893 RepID=A0A5E8BJI2_9ASCO|nr:uncharacterized protein SAPINGB_P002403 [Saprochaete ingens]VVT49707.1 unnamed protein product [Saprochaete ingens]